MVGKMKSKVAILNMPKVPMRSVSSLAAQTRYFSYVALWKKASSREEDDGLTGDVDLYLRRHQGQRCKAQQDKDRYALGCINCFTK